MFCQKLLVPLSADRLPFSLDWLPPRACLVGGAVRDALLNRQQDYLDLDFVVPELAIETAKKIANYYHAGFVVLDEKRQIARIVFPEGTVDFAQQEGETLETDLRRRDFTVNAIAYNPHQAQLIDPLHGLADLKQGILRMVSAKNLHDDPLRLLRAYRQAAQLNFIIDPATRSAIRQLAFLLRKIAAERVQTELGYLLATPQGSYWLIAAWEDGLIQPWLRHTTSEKLEQFARVDQSAALIRDILGEEKFSQFIPVTPESCCSKTIQLAKLSTLVAFLPDKAELELIILKYSRAEIRTVVNSLKYLPQLLENQESMSLKEQYFFFLGVGNVFPTLAILALAVGITQEKILPLIYRYLNPEDLVAHPKSLVTGNDLIKYLHLSPSPLIGKLLTEIQIARIEGKVSTLEEALSFATSLITSS